MPRLSFHATPALEREIERRITPELNKSAVIRGLLEAGLGADGPEIAAAQMRMQGRTYNKQILSRIGAALAKATEEALVELGLEARAETEDGLEPEDDGAPE